MNWVLVLIISNIVWRDLVVGKHCELERSSAISPFYLRFLYIRFDFLYRYIYRLTNYIYFSIHKMGVYLKVIGEPLTFWRVTKPVQVHKRIVCLLRFIRQFQLIGM